tara:strand:- start:189 stop:326 length:138 start_codon:yes stop_codon:yes gene_type:complete
VDMLDIQIKEAMRQEDRDLHDLTQIVFVHKPGDKEDMTPFKSPLL